MMHFLRVLLIKIIILMCLIYSLGGRAQIWVRLWSELTPVIQVKQDALLNAALKFFLFFARHGE